jgi:hypothetical protein
MRIVAKSSKLRPLLMFFISLGLWFSRLTFTLLFFSLVQIIKLVDVSYGGENGFNQAIELSAESLSNVKFIQEKKLIGRYFDEISQVSDF